jgi:hypothetical protein
MAVQEALTTKDKTIVYADVQMKHPIGYIGQWQRVRVGQVARNAGQVLPVHLPSNKIGYVSVEDLSIGRDFYALQNIAKMSAAQNKPLHYDAEFIIENFAGTINFNDPFVGSNKVNTNFMGYGVNLNRFINGHFNWRAGYQYQVANANDGVSISNQLFNVGLIYKAYNLGDLSFNLISSFEFSPYSQLKTRIFESTGHSYGYGFGAQVNYPLTHLVWLRSYVGYHWQQLMGMELPNNLGQFTPGIIGPRMNISLAIYY